MIDTIALYFAKEFQSEVDPFQMLLGSGIGIVAVVILVKKIISGRNSKSQKKKKTT